MFLSMVYCSTIGQFLYLSDIGPRSLSETASWFVSTRPFIYMFKFTFLDSFTICVQIVYMVSIRLLVSF